MKRIKKEPDCSPAKSVINVKINENDEIEYLDPDHDDEIPVEYEIEEINDDFEEGPELVQTSDGHMFIKMEKNKDAIVEHICGKCAEGFPDFEVRFFFFIVSGIVWFKILLNVYRH